MYCFGISNTAPDLFIEQLKASLGTKVTILPVGADLPKKVPSHLVVLCIEDFLSKSKKLNTPEYESTHVYVFASPIRLNEISGCVPLDFAYTPGTSRSCFTYKKLSLVPVKAASKKPPVVCKRDTSKFLFDLISSATEGSLLTPLMTFIYTLNASSSQTPVKEAIACWFVRNSSKEELFKTAAKYMTEAKLQQLKDILSGDSVPNFIAAYKEYRSTDTPNIKSICKRHSVPDYEFRYLLSVYNSAKEYKPVRGKSIREITKGSIRPQTKRVVAAQKSKDAAKQGQAPVSKITPKSKRADVERQHAPAAKTKNVKTSKTNTSGRKLKRPGRK